MLISDSSPQTGDTQMAAEVWTIIIVQAVASAFLCAFLAGTKNRDPVLWFLNGLLFGILALIAIAGATTARISGRDNSPGLSRPTSTEARSPLGEDRPRFDTPADLTDYATSGQQSSPNGPSLSQTLGVIFGDLWRAFQELTDKWPWQTLAALVVAATGIAATRSQASVGSFIEAMVWSPLVWLAVFVFVKCTKGPDVKL
jgi:hypothetical protein